MYGGSDAIAGHGEGEFFAEKARKFPTIQTKDLSQEIFHQPIKIGKPHLTGGVSDKVNSPRYSTSVGLVNYGNNNWNDEKYNQTKNIPSFMKNSFNIIGNYLKKWN